MTYEVQNTRVINANEMIERLWIKLFLELSILLLELFLRQLFQYYYFEASTQK